MPLFNQFFLSPTSWIRWRRLSPSLVIIGLCLGLGLSGLGSCGHGFSGATLKATDDPIRIGVLTSLSGDDMDIGQATTDGAALAVQRVNGQQGLLVSGHHHLVELINADTESTPEGAVKAAQGLINQKQVVAIVGPQYSRYAIPVAQLAERAQIPMISPRSSNPKTTEGKQYVFRAIFTDEFQGRVLARFAYNDLDAQRAAVLYDIASPYNRGIAMVFQQVFEDLGGEVTAFEDYTTGTTDFSSQLQQIHAAQPDVLFLPNYENEIPRQADQARQIGITAILLGSDAWGSMQHSDRNQSLEGAYFSDHYAPQADDVNTQDFIRQFQAAYGYQPPAGAAATYDSMGILFQAITQQNSTAADDIRRGIANLGEYQGVTGTLKYEGTGDPSVSVTLLKITNGNAVFYKKIDP